MNQQGAQSKILSPTAMLDYGRRFREAADALLGPNPGPVVPHAPVPHYLLAHAIELSLKAYLCACGYSEGELMRLGHDLEGALAQALGEGMSTHIALGADEIGAIQAVNEVYAHKELEYASISAGEAHACCKCKPKLLASGALRLQQGLRGYCLEKTKSLHQR